MDSKNFNLANVFWSINDRALIFDIHDPCDKPFQLAPCRDLDIDLLQGQSCCQAGDYSSPNLLVFSIIQWIIPKNQTKKTLDKFVIHEGDKIIYY